jgi:RNA polymerase sigma-70 factor (ECF subfamily)
VISVVGREADLPAPSTIAAARASQFAAFVEPYLAKMFHLAERLVGAANRDDVVQEALINAWTKRSQFDPSRGSLGGWLMAIVADQSRKSWRRRLPLATWRIEVQAEPAPDDHVDLERAIRALSPRQRLAVDCYYFCGLSVAETAAVMRCSEGTVKSTLSDARSRLRPALEVNA